MGDWWTYTLSDLQIFSARTYARLLETYNGAVWPAHIVALALGLWLAWRIRRGPPAGRGAVAAFAILAAAWVWVAAAFHWLRFASIHWAGHAFAAAFVLEAVLLLVDAARGRAFPPPGSAAANTGLAVLLFALLPQPLGGLLLGRAWRSTEVFGLAPDPTALATIGVVLAASGRRRWILLVIPVAWCAVSGATLLATCVPGAWITPAAAAAALVAAYAPRSSRSTAPR